MLKLNILLLKEKNINLQQFLFLWLISKRTAVKHKYIPDELISMGYLVHADERYYVSTSGLELISEVLSQEKSLANKDSYTHTAKEMIAMFPTGYKVKNVPWRTSVADLSRRLASFSEIYGEYTSDQIIDATRKYVDSYKNNLLYMRAVKFFVMKKDPKEGLISDLATYLEEDFAKPNNNYLWEEVL